MGEDGLGPDQEEPTHTAGRVLYSHVEEADPKDPWGPCHPMLLTPRLLRLPAFPLWTVLRKTIAAMETEDPFQMVTV